MVPDCDIAFLGVCGARGDVGGLLVGVDCSWRLPMRCTVSFGPLRRLVDLVPGRIGWSGMVGEAVHYFSCLKGV